MIKRILLLFVTVALLASCSSSKKIVTTRSGKARTTHTKKVKGGKFHNKKAVASYYANKFNGRKTASGEKFSNSKLTAAHKKLPFGTKVKVTNKANGKSVVVKINDRGPFVKGRHIDLSKKAFMQITDSKKAGLLNVTIQIVK
ncbi:septal ring lytic transglycosylase RlpA family protein [uncultured Flavobacterium sp.]|uniref:septal ring lytic transglycosylase RlpA family protein n=1 Tax=uncultured Flavobacterium sp. TaxID=165435 RepID=UPI0025DFD260|nr:septal ring lytic transglycosylase RlpA family protein [uncultured Flavobacterium sp.]